MSAAQYNTAQRKDLFWIRGDVCKQELSAMVEARKGKKPALGQLVNLEEKIEAMSESITRLEQKLVKLTDIDLEENPVSDRDNSSEGVSDTECEENTGTWKEVKKTEKKKPPSFADQVLEAVKAANKAELEQAARDKNFVIFNIPESEAGTHQERREEDNNTVRSLLSDTLKVKIEAKETLRLGRYDPKKKRPIKVCLDSNDSRLIVMSRLSKLKSQRASGMLALRLTLARKRGTM